MEGIRINKMINSMFLNAVLDYMNYHSLSVTLFIFSLHKVIQLDLCGEL